MALLGQVAGGTSEHHLRLPADELGLGGHPGEHIHGGLGKVLSLSTGCQVQRDTLGVLPVRPDPTGRSLEKGLCPGSWHRMAALSHFHYSQGACSLHENSRCCFTHGNEATGAMGTSKQLLLGFSGQRCGRSGQRELLWSCFAWKALD